MDTPAESKSTNQEVTPGAQDTGLGHDEKPGDVVEMTPDAYTPEEERRVLRKIDMTILPMVRETRQPPLKMWLTNYLIRCALFSSSNTSTSRVLVTRVYVNRALNIPAVVC